MVRIFDDNFVIGSAGSTGRPSKADTLSPAERALLEQIADKLLQEHGETLKKLGDE